MGIIIIISVGLVFFKLKGKQMYSNRKADGKIPSYDHYKQARLHGVGIEVGEIHPE